MSGVADIVELQEERSKRVPLTDSEFANAGAMLKAAREAAGYSIDDVNEATNVRADYLESIEAMDIESLPIPAYTSGFVKAYAQFLELPDEALVARFRKETGYESSPIAPELPVAPKDDLAGGRELSLLAVVGILFFVIWVAYQITRPPRDSGPVEVAGTPLVQRPISEPEISFTAENELPVAEGEVSAAPDAQPGTDQTLSSPEESPVDTPSDRAIIEPEQTDSDEPEGTELDSNEIPVVEIPEEIASAADNSAVDPEVLGELLVGATEPQSLADQLTEALAASDQDLVPVDEEAVTEQDEGAGDVEQPAVLPEEETSETPTEESAASRTVTEPVLTEPVRTTMISPIYPARCQRRADDIERVVVSFDVDSGGQPINQRVARTSNPCFNTATLNAVDRWTFDPATRNGVPVASYGRSAEFSFKLPE